MGLDSYLYASKPLSPRRRIEKLYIEFFNSLPPKFGNGESHYIYHEYRTHIDRLPRFTGQMGDIVNIKKIDNKWHVLCEAGYWRKANAIHNWFVEKVQDGIDANDGSENPVSKEILDELTTIIKLAIGGRYLSKLDDKWTASNRDIARFNQYMPTQSGFFFGSTEYDYWYLRQLHYTNKKLKKVNSKAGQEWQYYYHASW